MAQVFTKKYQKLYFVVDFCKNTFTNIVRALKSYRKSVPIAQPVEHLTFNQRVAGSNPAGHTN